MNCAYFLHTGPSYTTTDAKNAFELARLFSPIWGTSKVVFSPESIFFLQTPQKHDYILFRPQTKRHKDYDGQDLVTLAQECTIKICTRIIFENYGNLP